MQLTDAGWASNAKVIFWPLFAVVLLSPLPFGSVELWAWAALATATGLILLLWSTGLALGQASVAVPMRRIGWSAVLFGAVACWVLVQISGETPAAWHHPIWAEAANALGREVPGRVAVDPYEALSTLVRLLTYAGIFWLCLQYGRDRKRVELALYVFVGASCIYAVYGLLVEFTNSQTVLWLPKEFYRDNLTSSFVNRNSYATFAGLGLLATTAILTRRFLKLQLGSGRRERLRNFMVAMAEREWRYVLVWIVILTALLLTDSRAGFTATCLGLLAYVVLIAASRSVPRQIGRAIAGAIALAIAAFFVVSGDTVAQRIADTNAESDKVRAELYDMTMRAISDSPILGHGLGSFEEMFYVYRPDLYYMRLRSSRAHNTYLENAMELGVPAAAALVASVAIVVGICFIGVKRRRRDAIYPALGCAAAVLVGVHSMVDFSLQIPAVAATFAALLGLACAQSWGSEERL